jgi:hypothetical protein
LIQLPTEAGMVPDSPLDATEKYVMSVKAPTSGEIVPTRLEFHRLLRARVGVAGSAAAGEGVVMARWWWFVRVHAHGDDRGAGPVAGIAGPAGIARPQARVGSRAGPTTSQGPARATCPIPERLPRGTLVCSEIHRSSGTRGVQQQAPAQRALLHRRRHRRLRSVMTGRQKMRARADRPPAPDSSKRRHRGD